MDGVGVPCWPIRLLRECGGILHIRRNSKQCGRVRFGRDGHRDRRRFRSRRPGRKKDTHEDASDDEWDSASSVAIVFEGDSIRTEGGGATVDGATVTINAAGTYSLSGALTDGRVIVDTEDEGVVWLILDGVDLRCSNGSPITVLSAEKAVILLAEGSENSVTDGDRYDLPDSETDEPNAAIFSTADLTISGSGSLTVLAKYNDGIASKDGLILSGGTITVTAADDGLRGKDYLVVEDTDLTVTAQGDGIKSDNEDDPQKGYIYIKSGTLHITAGEDGIQAQTDVLISSGNSPSPRAGEAAAARAELQPPRVFRHRRTSISTAGPSSSIPRTIRSTPTAA
jgi:hypothetical protein